MPALSLSRGASDYIKPLLANMIYQMLHLPFVIVSFHQPQIQNRTRRCRNHIAREIAHVATAHAIDIERWLVDELEQTFSVSFGSRETELRAQLIIKGRRCGNRLSFSFAPRFHTVVLSVARHAATVVFHGRQQAG